VESLSLKKEFLKLLETDEEFRYAIIGLIGLKELIKRLDKHGEELVKLREDFNKLGEEQVRLREEQIKLREDFNELRKEQIKLREDFTKGMNAVWNEIFKLREDMNKGFELMERHISALGARWGLLSEEAFREGLKGLLEKEFKFKVEKWSHYDEEGIVYGYPSQIEIDIAIKDEKIILVEVASHAKASDVYAFKRKSNFYEKITKKKPSRLLIITPYADEKALEAAKSLGVEVYTKV